MTRWAVLIVCVFALLAWVATSLNDVAISRKAALIMSGGHKDTIKWTYDAESWTK